MTMASLQGLWEEPRQVIDGPPGQQTKQEIERFHYQDYPENLYSAGCQIQSFEYILAEILKQGN